MFRPNLDGYIRKRGGRDLFGKASYHEPRHTRCALVNLSTMIEQTSVRADSSASRGGAFQDEVMAKILVPAGTDVDKGDRFEVMDFRLEVMRRHPRLDTQGNVDHIEIAAKIEEED